MNYDDLKQGEYIGSTALTESQKKIVWDKLEDKKVAYFKLLQYLKNLENHFVELESRPDNYLIRLDKTVIRLERLLLWNENDGWCVRLIKKWMSARAKGKDSFI